MPHCLFWSSPASCFWLAFDTNYNAGAATDYWYSIFFVAGLSILFIWVASFVLPRKYQDEAVENQKPPRWFKSPTLGDGDPIVWLGSHDMKVRIMAWTAAGLLMPPIAAAFLVGLHYMTESLANMIAAGCFLLSNLLLRWLVAEMSCRRLGQDRISGALELLLTTPVEHEQILPNLREGFAKVFYGPIKFVVICSLVLAVFGIAYGLPVLMIPALSAISFAVEYIALLDVGQWRGLCAKTPNRALLGALGLTSGIIWFAFGMLALVGSLKLLGLWVFYTLFYNLRIAAFARTRLKRGVRVLLNLD